MQRENEELRHQLNTLSNQGTQLEKEPVHIDYQKIRDRILANLKVGKQAPKYKTSKALLDEFIEELKKPND
ncbi:hypothetical protein [Scytonema sp. PCC 10023]|uniref:hypothetical protein n=1 Tax=Scytonema sp. PCC 10023 TaxID=1680591 RepID=UPI0039C6D605